MKLNILEAISNPNFKLSGTILVADLVDSTGMKQQITEAAWLGTYARLFDTVIEALPEKSEFVKFTGDGVLAFFTEDDATLAVNTAIKIQEAVENLVSNENFRDYLSIGIASGRLNRVPVSDDRWDYLGSTVDRAFRLCSVAAPKAILVDANTVGAANITKIVSVSGFGDTPRRDRYVTDEVRIPLKGFNNTVPVHSIHWAREPYGVKLEYVSEANKMAKQQQAALVAEQVLEKAVVNSPSRERGVFDHWTADHRSGFIVADGHRFHLRSEAVLLDVELRSGDKVTFFAVEAKPSMSANGVIKIGSKATGRVVNRPEGKKFAFAQVAELRAYGHENIYLKNLPDDVGVGDEVTFEIFEEYSERKQAYTLSGINVLKTE